MPGEGVGCDGCAMERYCGEDCKVAGEEEHEEDCRVLGKLGTHAMVLSDQLRLVAKIWLKIRKSGHEFSEKNEITSKSWGDLMDHAEELMKDSEELLLAHYNALAAVIKKADMPPMEVFVEIYGRILTNSFSLRSDRKITVDSLHNLLYHTQFFRRIKGYSSPEPFGTGIYLLASIFDHSCTPNCTVVFKGRELVVMATEDIPAGDITSVAFISYLNTMDDIKTRQLQQKAIWYFSCHCSLCQDTRMDQEKHSIKCGKCEKGRPVDTIKWKLYGPCTNCCYRKEKEDKEQVTRYKKLYTIITDYEPGGEGSSEMSYDDLCEWCAGEMEDVFSSRDILYVQTVHYVHTACMASRRWSAAATYGEIALTAFRRYYGHKTGVVAALLVRLGEAYGETGDVEKACEHFQEADSIYTVIPGVKHPFYKEDFRPLYGKYVDT